MQLRMVLIGGLLLAGLWAPLAPAQVARQAFGAQATPSDHPPEPIGGYAAGCLAGAVELPETGPGWQAMRLDRNRNWGHPDAIAFIRRLSETAAGIGWLRLYVGDIAQPRGGPMLSGHSSHQSGLDIDIWLRPSEPEPLSREARERISSVSVVRADGSGVNGAWTRRHHALLRAAATDGSVARIFVNPAIKKALCDAEPAGERGWLRRIRPWWGHDAHFHVRLKCPDSATSCERQAPIPEGDGCDATLDWWFGEEARTPSSPGGPREELMVSDLPPACRSVLAR